ncbi:porin family protein [Capnocytophaga sp.]|uniref:porin family protein n=1 Tax=Capnocytophaga sp. TaxID=44737 RepID=UPI0026DD9A13|nr:porin family protein [Capnocytophaga sp.]MDO5104539.1 porin family protein [Capnocytophaga sp.]
MKKFFVTVGVAIATVFTAQAQELKFGVKAGLNIATLSSSINEANGTEKLVSEFNESYKTGYHIGAFAELGLSEKLFLEAGLGYTAQGAKYKSADLKVYSNGNLVETVKADFKDAYTNVGLITLPVWIKYDISGFRPKAGISLGYAVNSKTSVWDKESTSAEVITKTKSAFDFGLGVGAEYNLPFGLFFDATFNFGLTSLSQETPKDKDGTANADFKFKNRVFQIGVGYKF